MVGGVAIWQRIETFTGIIEGHPHQQGYKDERTQTIVGRLLIQGKTFKRFLNGVKEWVPVYICQRASLITSNFLNFHSKD